MDNFRGPDSSPNCADCPCSVNGLPQRPIRGSGSLNSLAIIGDGPSTEELSQGWPFVGPAGKLLQQALNSSNIDRHSIWLTNSILCQKPRDESALATAVQCCRPRLAHELALVQPQAILALGGTVTLALELPVTAISSCRGTVQSSPLIPSAHVVTALHPGDILRGGGAGANKASASGKNKMNVDAQYVFLESDLAKAYSLALNPSQPLWQDDIHIFENGVTDVSIFISRFAQANLLAIDLEWNKNNAITWVGLATDEYAISIYLPHIGSIIRAELKQLGESNIPKLFHNLQADVPMWEGQIGKLGGVFEDTMLMHHAAYPGAAHDLQNVASQFLLVPPWKADRKNEEKQAVKAIAAKSRALAKSAKQIAHEAKNAATSGEAKVRKARRKQAHDDKNTVAHLLKLLGE